MLLCALYFLKKKNLTSVTFVTCNTGLAKQMKREITALWRKGAGGFKFGAVDDPSSIEPS